MSIRLTRLIIMLLALAVSSLPTACFAKTAVRKEAVLTVCQTNGETEFIPVNLESEIQHSNARPCVVTIPYNTILVPANPVTEHIILCKKACSAGQVCVALPLRL
jgi:hypothetical protein